MTEAKGKGKMEGERPPPIKKFWLRTAPGKVLDVCSHIVDECKKGRNIAIRQKRQGNSTS